MLVRLASRLAALVVTAAVLAGPAAAQPVAAGSTGVAIGVADWIGPPGPDFGGWGLVSAGGSYTDAVAWTETDDFLAVPPGTYDLYWYQDDALNPLPLKMTEVEVTAGVVPSVRIATGVRLGVADWVPPRSESGWWGAAPVGGNPDDAVNWTHAGSTLVLPPGDYDIFYAESADRPALLIARPTVGPPFGGIGIEVSSEVKGVLVVDVFASGGAAAAGILAGDVIIAADDTPLAGLSLADAVAEIRGPAESVVALSIVRTGAVTPIEILVARGRVEAPTAVDLDYGIVPILPPSVAPLGPDGSWWAVFAGADPSARVNWSDGDSTRPIVLGPDAYDVYWQPDPAAPARLVAADVSVIELTEIRIPPAPRETTPAASPAPPPPPTGAAPPKDAPKR